MLCSREQELVIRSLDNTLRMASILLPKRRRPASVFGLSEGVQARQFALLFYSGGAPHAGRQCDVSDVSATERPAKLAV
jgi:hypothetical protein